MRLGSLGDEFPPERRPRSVPHHLCWRTVTPCRVIVLSVVSAALIIACGSDPTDPDTKFNREKPQLTFYADILRDYPPAGTIGVDTVEHLGDAFCGELRAGKQIDTVVRDVMNAAHNRMEPQFVAALLVDATADLCPKYAPSAQRWVNSH